VNSWVRRQFDGIGLTQSPPGPHLAALQAKHGGTVLLCIDVSGSMSGEPLKQAITGGTEFLKEAKAAHYKSGLILWSDNVDHYVPPDAPHKKVVGALAAASIVGGTMLAPALKLALKDLAPQTGDRVLCIFSDGGLGDRAESVKLARKLCALGVRIIVRGLGHGAASGLAELACPGETDDNQEIADVSTIGAGIASMARGLTTRRTPR
jgi:Mg-chelatase subunit ChlD